MSALMQEVTTALAYVKHTIIVEWPSVTTTAQLFGSRWVTVSPREITGRLLLFRRIVISVVRLRASRK